MGTALITGANRGIGLELCRQLEKRGEDVIAVCRESSTELDGLGVEIEAGVDVTSDAAVQALAGRQGDRRIDLLVNNAGLLTVESLEMMDFDRIRKQFEINSLGPLRVTAALAGNLGKGSKVAIVTSLMGSMTDNTSGGSYGYRMSKAAVNAAGVSLARDLASRGVAVAILHPGYVKTRMTRGRGNMEPHESAAGLLQRIDALTLETSGGFWHADGRELPW
jgi:NAD(P)-dependent dehydrogenase (short-subunit alcohol dehydrogenase family)